MFRILTVLALATALSACAAGRTSGSMPLPGAAPPVGARIPSGPIELGDWRRAGADAVLRRYADQIARRYAAGVPLADAANDLQRNQFSCAPAQSGRGDPPDRVCRRQISEGDCTHTWQTHLWDDAPGPATKVSRVRGLYDRRCKSDDGLLGGPG